MAQKVNLKVLKFGDLPDILTYNFEIRSYDTVPVNLDDYRIVYWVKHPYTKPMIYTGAGAAGAYGDQSGTSGPIPTVTFTFQCFDYEYGQAPRITPSDVQYNSRNILTFSGGTTITAYDGFVRGIYHAFRTNEYNYRDVGDTANSYSYEALGTYQDNPTFVLEWYNSATSAYEKVQEYTSSATLDSNSGKYPYEDIYPGNTDNTTVDHTLLVPDADTWLDQQNPALNHGLGDLLFIHDQGNPATDNNRFRPCLHFDILSVATSSDYISASKLFLAGNTDKEDSFSVYPMIQDWSETDADWLTHDGINSWANSGGDFENNILDTIATIAAGPATSRFGGASGNVRPWWIWGTSKLTDLVNDWIMGTSANAGLLIKYTDELKNDGPAQPRFYSRQAVTSAWGTPMLVISGIGTSATPPLPVVINTSATPLQTYININPRDAEVIAINDFTDVYTITQSIDIKVNDPEYVFTDDSNNKLKNDRLINLVQMLPNAYDDSDVYDFMKFFENFLNYDLFTRKLDVELDKQRLSILKKIELLWTLRDPDNIDIDFIQFFANYLGYSINYNREDIINITGDTQTTIVNRYLRETIRSLPHFYKLKTTNNALSMIMYMFGVVSDVYTLWTDDYSSNWVEENPSFDTNTVPPEIPEGYYPTPHFKISVDISKTPEGWESNINKIIRLVESIKPINTVFEGFAAKDYTDININIFTSYTTVESEQTSAMFN